MKHLEFWHDHAGVSVPNLDAAVAWYKSVLGFELERRIVIESIPANVAVLKNGNLRMELFEAIGGKAPAEERSIPDQDIKTWGNKHVSFAVDDVIVVGEELKRRGADGNCRELRGPAGLRSGPRGVRIRLRPRRPVSRPSPAATWRSAARS